MSPAIPEYRIAVQEEYHVALAGCDQQSPVSERPLLPFQSTQSCGLRRVPSESR